MKMKHGKNTIVRAPGLSMVAEVEKDGWITIGHIGSPGITITVDEWSAFWRLCNEIDTMRLKK